MGYFEEMLNFIESVDMRDYLQTIANTFTPTHCECRISAAYAPLTKKQAALTRLYDETKDEWTGKVRLPMIRNALAARYADTNGAVFALTYRYSHFCWDEGALPIDAEMGFDIARYDNGATLYTSYGAAIKGLKEQVAEEEESLDEGEIRDRDWAWFTIDKWTRTQDGKLRRVTRWHLNMDGEEIYFDYPDDDKKRYRQYSFPEYRDMNFPAPFQVGDIITVDIQPFVDEFHVVVICSRDCVTIIAYVDEQGEIKSRNLQYIYQPYPMSPFYRAAAFTGELPKRELPLKALAEQLRKEPRKAKAIRKRIPFVQGENDGKRVIGIFSVSK